MDLRESARHDDILVGRDQFHARLVVVAANILGIGGIEHQQHILRQRRMQATHLLERQIGAGRVVGVGEEDDPGVGRQRHNDVVDTGLLAIFLGNDGNGARCLGVDLVDHEAMLGVDGFVAWREVALRQQAQHLVGAVRAQDVGRVEPMGRRNRLSQA